MAAGTYGCHTLLHSCICTSLSFTGWPGEQKHSQKIPYKQKELQKMVRSYLNRFKMELQESQNWQFTSNTGILLNNLLLRWIPAFCLLTSRSQTQSNAQNMQDILAGLDEKQQHQVCCVIAKWNKTISWVGIFFNCLCKQEFRLQDTPQKSLCIIQIKKSHLEFHIQLCVQHFKRNTEPWQKNFE